MVESNQSSTPFPESLQTGTKHKIETETKQTETFNEAKNGAELRRGMLYDVARQGEPHAASLHGCHGILGRKKTPHAVCVSPAVSKHAAPRCSFRRLYTDDIPSGDKKMRADTERRVSTCWRLSGRCLCLMKINGL